MDHWGITHRANAMDLFARLMDLYEQNYILMRRLAPELPAPKVGAISQVPGALDLHLRALERFRYTSECQLTYQFLREHGLLLQPDLRIRIYHDARLAEVLSWTPRHTSPFQLLEEDQSQLKMKWKANRFLYKWLHYCLGQGHQFLQQYQGQTPIGFVRTNS